MGNGLSIKFWSDVWLGSECLKDCFPRLYQVSSQKEANISQMGEWRGTSWCWNWAWRRSFFDWEVGIFEELQGILTQVCVQQDVEDTWVWKPDPLRGFSVKSAYSTFYNSANTILLDLDAERIFHKLWQCSVPSKILVFAWRLLQDRLPTREALLKRGVISGTHNDSCVFCFIQRESCSHLFFSCQFSYAIWVAVYSWLGISTVSHIEGREHFIQHGFFLRGKRYRKVRHIVWLAVVWSLWTMRNKVIFQGTPADFIHVMDHIKMISWCWFIYREGTACSLCFSDWCSSPRSCLEEVKSR